MLSKPRRAIPQFLFPAGDPVPKRPARRMHFTRCPERREAVELLRGSVLERFEWLFHSGPLGGLFFQGGKPPEVTLRFVERVSAAKTRTDVLRACRVYGVDLFQEMLYVLFPEVFFEAEWEDGRDPGEFGLIPPNGPRRLGWERVALAAEVYREIRAEKERAGEAPVGPEEAGRRLREDVTSGPGRRAV